MKEGQLRSLYNHLLVTNPKRLIQQDESLGHLLVMRGMVDKLDVN